MIGYLRLVRGRNATRLTGALIAGLAVLVLAAPGAAGAAVRYAEPGGDGPEPCLAADACDLQVAVESLAVMDGDEVVVRSGDYMLGGGELLIEDDINLHGQSGQPRPRILGTGLSVVRTNSTFDARISDLTIRADAGTALSFAATIVERVDATTGDGVACAPFFTSTIRDSVCRSTGGSGSSGLAVGCGGACNYDVRVVNVTAVGDDYGIRLDVNGGANITINASNAIAQGGTFDVRAGATDMDAGNDPDVVLDHSNYRTREVVGANASVTAPGSGANQTAAPLLVNAAAGDFHQLPASPTRNAGAAVTGLGSLDIDRQARRQGIAPDIGADEFSEPTFRCAGRLATRVGTAGRDAIRGTRGRDVIVGLGRRDTINGLAGRDLICGGRGPDRLFGGPGRDRLLGQAGRDFLRGGPGRDRLRGGPGRDNQTQ